MITVPQSKAKLPSKQPTYHRASQLWCSTQVVCNSNTVLNIHQNDTRKAHKTQTQNPKRSILQMTA